MYSKTSKWINVLSILLALLSMGELIFTASALYLVSIILSKTGGYMTTICGLIASLVSMPTAFKVRSFYSSMEIRVHHFDMQTYHRFMLYISLGVQTFCIIICCVSLSENQNVEFALTSAVTRYQRRFTDKKFVDITQILFQCCGIFSYQDWAQESWITSSKQEIFCLKPVKTVEILNQTLEKNVFSPVAKEENMKFLYTVPYSCCNVEISKPCRNFDLKCSGVETINTNGCIDGLTGFIISILFSEFVIFLCIIVIIIVLLKLLIMEECEICRDEFEDFEGLSDYLNNDLNDEDNTDDFQWQKFTNSVQTSKINPTTEEKLLVEETTSYSIIEFETTLATAELVPTSQEQIVLSNDKKAEIVSTSSQNKVKDSKDNLQNSKKKCCCISDLSIPPDKTFELVTTSKNTLLLPEEKNVEASASSSEDEIVPKGTTFRLVDTERQLVPTKMEYNTFYLPSCQKKVRFE